MSQQVLSESSTSTTGAPAAAAAVSLLALKEWAVAIAALGSGDQTVSGHGRVGGPHCFEKTP